MTEYTLDRIEEGTAVLETKNGDFEKISVALLPETVKSGDIILLDDGEYKILQEETERRREKIKTLRKSLFE